MNEDSCACIILPPIKPGMSIAEYERELMDRRDKLLSQLLVPQINEDFTEFMNCSKSSRFILIFNIFLMTMFFPFLILAAVDPASERYYSFLLTLIEIALTVISICCGWFIYFIVRFRCPLCGIWFLPENIRKCDPNIICSCLQSWLCVLLIALNGIIILHRIANGECRSSFQRELCNWSCNSWASSDAVPFDSMFLLMSIPIIFIGVLRESRVQFILFSWGLSIFFLLLASIMIRSFKPLLHTIIYAVISFVGLLDLVKQYFLFFLLCEKLKSSLEKNEKLAAKNKAAEMRNLIANVAHDLKTPLASFMTGVDIISRDVCECDQMSRNGCLTPDYLAEFMVGIKSCLENIQNTNSFMIMTINRCLDYTKASNGLKLTPKYETIDLRECLQMPLSCMSSVQSKKFILEPISEDICSHIITDKQWLQENLLCFLSNAAKYSSDGDIVIRVQKEKRDERSKIPANIEDEDIITESVLNVNKHSTKADSETEESEEFLMFEVSDNGIGMAKDATRSLFNPFKKIQRLAGGTGLGLYSLAKRIEALKGHYGAHLRDDGQQGSVFWFTIPYRPDFVVASLSQKEEGTLQNADSNEIPSTPDSLYILIAEDTPSIAKMTTAMLRRHGHTTKIAENGAILLKILEDDESAGLPAPDVILMDLQMPVLDGLEATKRLRAREKEIKRKENRNVHHLVIGVSANSDHETMGEAFEVGVDKFLPKPFGVEDLLTVMKSCQEKLKNQSET